MSKALNPIFKVLLCVCALSVGGAGAAYAGPKEDARDLMSPRNFGTPKLCGGGKVGTASC